MANKRLNYFKGQLLTENDFIEEQEYHNKVLRQHNMNLHAWGIAQGLEVKTLGEKKLVVGKGMAVDNQGRQIVIEDDKEIDLSAAPASTQYLTISFNESKTDLINEVGIKGETRITEEPKIELSVNIPDDSSIKIILAKVILDNDAIKIDTHDRKIIGLSGDMEANSIAFKISEDSRKWPRIEAAEGGSLEIKSQNTILTGNLEIKGSLSGKLSKNIVGRDQIADKSVSISKFEAQPLVGNGEILAGEEREIQVLPSIDEKYGYDPTEHNLLIASVKPLTKDSTIDWWWRIKQDKDTLYHILVIKNLSGKDIQYDFMCYAFFLHRDKNVRQKQSISADVDEKEDLDKQSEK